MSNSIYLVEWAKKEVESTREEIELHGWNELDDWTKDQYQVALQILASQA